MITQKYLKSILNYDPETGLFVWKLTQFRVRVGGKPAGTIIKGYVFIKISGRIYPASRLAWLYIYGEDKLLLDHKDRDRSNNRISNLRPASNAQNIANSSLASNNTSGYKGVSLHYGKWWARIQVEGKRVALGVFNTAEEAHEAYRRAAIARLGEFANAARAEQ